MDWVRVVWIATGSLVVLALLGWLLVWASVRSHGVSLAYDLEERLPTADGSFIELRRLPSPAEARDLPPVLLVHGLGANHRNNDLTEDLSLARFLQKRGRDVWLLTLRSGLARRTFADVRRTRFEAMVKQDLPLAIREVLARTQAKQLDYVGFSMGGMLLYAAIGTTVPVESFHKVAIIGSPAIVRSPLPLPLPRIVGRIPAQLFPTVRLRWAARAGAFAASRMRTFAHHWVFNPDNVGKGVTGSALVNVIEDVPGPLNLDFATWASSVDGRITFEGRPVLERLGDLTVPVVFFAGSADRLAPPAAVRAAFEHWGENTSVDKRFVLLSRETGAKADYGHGDLAVGSHAKEEVFEPLAAFLEGES
jgi:pimeloyl-ACP methyl ester carboxylesterase